MNASAASATPDLDQVFGALGDSTRRSILNRLTDGELPLSTLAVGYSMSQTAVTKHVRVLRNAGLVSVSKRGRTRYCRLRAVPMKDAADWLRSYQTFWQGQLSALDAYLKEENP